VISRALRRRHGPRRAESDSSGDEQKESSSSESHQEEEVLSEHIKSTLSLAVSTGYHGCATAPPLDNSLVGRLVAFRWNMGWEVGTVNTIHDLSRSRHASETKLNWHIPT